MLLEARNISKSFPGVKALDDVSLQFYPGQVNVILGENGAGKSTLLKILTGVYPQYEGSILLDGKVLRFGSVREAQRAGIAIIHQELNLIPQLTVSENLFLGRELHRELGLLDSTEMNRQTQAVLEKLQLDIAPQTPVRRLKVGEQQLVEIARALLTDAEVILMDEPTSALSDTEIDNLHRIIRDLKADGKTIVYISHKMDELFRIADHYTVLRDGVMVGTGKMEDTTEAELIRLMVGRELKIEAKTLVTQSDEVVMRVKDLDLDHPYVRQRKVLENISFNLKRGEILGIFGLMGAGRTELLETLFGLHPGRSRYRLEIEGTARQFKSPQEAIRQGLAFVTEDRKAEGLILGMDIAANISLPTLSETPMLQPQREKELARSYVDQLAIKTPSERQLCRNLSGGNQQKVVLAKWLSTRPKILFMDEPTRGIDIKAKHELYELMKQLVADGLSILLVSSEIPEILTLSDRILVMAEGRITGDFSVTEADEDHLLKAALPG
ncbi:sugar ABC transporter ATP-binding protein [Flavilitoribacter nigricans]|uniref:D-xylose ABC transporter ATP-binding protein n=1 Tax=Flavilitoribacter nigricans (strain ATCC 23147 / DSM 23189 / NBRC 102662 / NCIMB 1420 / SS-2) TaxID=1122177 RepID=A0A2D0NEL0_FLAN2|nr:sugar ABC transporter ATP-binding protein [Flavilitoribacter nigricans]PHN06806.1 D-xylose ABC transporter ATP-binding protein [Flavilitoribacter nigricans DSM 23189 = NBRC 102662]